MKLTEIHANKANPRVMRDEKFRKLKKSIQEFPKMLALRPIVVDDSNTIVGGNMRYRALQDLGFKEIPSEWVKKAADLTEEEKKRFVIADNVNFGEWDYDLLANEWDNDLLLDWGLDTWQEPKDNEEEETEKDSEDEEEEESEKENFLESMLGDRIYSSNNIYDIPTLDINLQPTEGLLIPFAAWGTDSRLTIGIATYCFYVDDYRFEAIWKNPNKVLASGCVHLVEPNLSLFDTTPVAFGLFQIYRKRWIARYWQSVGMKVYADLNVSAKFYEYNKLGIPKGYNAFATRGYADRLEYLEREIQIAKEISGLDKPNMIVYGGGDKIKAVCDKYCLIYVPQFMKNRDNVIKEKYNGKN